jgi:hypothetical protein
MEQCNVARNSPRSRWVHRVKDMLVGGVQGGLIGQRCAFRYVLSVVYDAQMMLVAVRDGSEKYRRVNSGRLRLIMREGKEMTVAAGPVLNAAHAIVSIGSMGWI